MNTNVINRPLQRFGRKNAGALGGTAADPAKVTEQKEVTHEEISGIVTKAVQAAVAGVKVNFNADDLSKAIAAEMTKQAADSKKLTVADVEAAATKAAQAVLDTFRKDNKNVFENADANRGQIEMPYSWSKGNLPLHGKQLLNIMTGKSVNEGIDQKDISRGIELGEKMVQRYRTQARAGSKAVMTSTGVGSGDEFVPTELSAELQRRFYLASDFAAVLASTEIEMPSEPYKYPLRTTRPSFNLETVEGTDTADSPPGTGEIVLDAKKFMGKVSYSYELDEDSIVPILNNVQTDLSDAAAATFESAVINGDTTGTHMDSDTNGNAKAPERAFPGLRKLALAVAGLKVDFSTGGLSDANLRALKKSLKKYGLRPSDLIWIVGANAVNDLLGLAQAQTLEKFGPRATILTGEVAALYGIPIITSAAVREDLNASAVYDGSVTTKGSILLLNKANFLTGRRRQFTVEIFRDVKKQQNDVVASFRKAFVSKETPSATITTVGIGYNYTA